MTAPIQAHDRPRASVLDELEPAAASKRRMLIIVNPYAATVSERLRHLVVYALQGRFDAFEAKYKELQALLHRQMRQPEKETEALAAELRKEAQRPPVESRTLDGKK